MWLATAFAGTAILSSVWWWQGKNANTSASKGPTGITTAIRPIPVENPLERALHEFQKPPRRETALQSLNDLKAKLSSMPRDEAVGWIRSFLDAGTDKPTGLSFEIGKDQSLSEWPSFRVFLLDIILSIDPAAAIGISRKILSSPTSADEWALALRNIGKADPSAGSAIYLR